MKEVSLGKAKTQVKAGVKQLQSVQGLKRTAVHFGVGFAIGAIVDLILQYIFCCLIYPNTRDPTTHAEPRIEGFFAIYPNDYTADGVPYIHWDDVILIVATVLMLFSKKLWFVVGFGLGWYVSGYMGLYTALGLPPEPTA